MMMEYFKRRFSSTEIPMITRLSLDDEHTRDKIKILLVIDTEQIDW